MRKLPLDDTLKEIDIYLILSKISNEVFVWKIKHGNLKQAYKDHTNGRNEQTKELFVRSEEADQFPLMYLLETIISTDEEAYQHCLAWTRYFTWRGYISISKKSLVKASEDLLPNTEAFYLEIKGKPLDEILSKEHLIKDGFQRKGEVKNSENRVTFRTSREELEELKAKAEEQGIHVSTYAKHMAQNGVIVTIDRPDSYQYLEEIRDVKSLLRQILMTCSSAGAHDREILEGIQSAIDRATESEKELAQVYEENTKYLMQMLPKYGKHKRLSKVSVKEKRTPQKVYMRVPDVMVGHADELTSVGVQLDFGALKMEEAELRAAINRDALANLFYDEDIEPEEIEFLSKDAYRYEFETED